MPELTATLYITLMIQAGGALLTAAVFRSFHAHYRKSYLDYFQGSWLALAAYHIAAATNLFLTHFSPGVGVAATTIIAAVAAGVQVPLLLIGAYELSTSRVLPTRRVKQGIAVIAFAALAASLVFIGDRDASGSALLLRVGVRSFLSGLGFLLASYGVWRAHGSARGFGPRMVSGAFLVYGLLQLHDASVGVIGVLTGRAFEYTLYVGFLAFLLQFVLALGMVVWLLEQEQRATMDAAAHIEHLAYHDSLTGLPNRQLFLDRLNVAIAGAQRSHQRLAIFFLDLDRFKLINDSLGHHMGDQLLQTIATRMTGLLRKDDTVTRLGGDEFTILVPHLRHTEDAIVVARKVRDALKQPIEVDGRELYVTTSIGISLYPNDGEDAATLLRNADAAMYRAKAQGRDTFRLYAPAMNAKALEQLALENSLRKALSNDELLLQYQPIVAFETGAITGVEALLRWSHPELGLLVPANFISLAEATGLITPIGEWALREAARQVRVWHDAGFTSLSAACNLSVRQLQQPDFVETVSSILAETGLPGKALELELTESIAMQSDDDTILKLRELKRLGVRISIDDFGTGYSSLSALRLFPVDALKIDQTFVHDITSTSGDAAIATAVIAMAHSLDLTVIAEGVETEGQRAFLKDHGCNAYQGYLVSRPLSAEACERMLYEGVAESSVAGSLVRSRRAAG